MRAGPKGEIKAEPLDLKGWPAERAKRRIRFVGKYVIVPKGVGAGKPMRLRRFQSEIILGAYALGIPDRRGRPDGRGRRPPRPQALAPRRPSRDVGQERHPLPLRSTLPGSFAETPADADRAGRRGLPRPGRRPIGRRPGRRAPACREFDGPALRP